MDKLCERIYALRKKAGMSQEELAHRTGVSRQTVSKWESGAMVPESANLRTLCLLFEVSADFLLFGEEKFTSEPEPETPQTKEKEQELELLLQRETLRRESDREDLHYKQALYLCATIFMSALTLISVFFAVLTTYELIYHIRYPENVTEYPFLFLFSPPVMLGISLFFSIMFATFTVLIAVAFHRTRKKIKNVMFC